MEEKDSSIKNFELRVQNLNQANDQLREETNRLNLLISRGDERIKGLTADLEARERSLGDLKGKLSTTELELQGIKDRLWESQNLN